MIVSGNISVIHEIELYRLDLTLFMDEEFFQINLQHSNFRNALNEREIFCDFY